MLTRYFRLQSISQLRFLVQTVQIEEEYYEEIDYLSTCPKGPEKKKIQQTLEFNKPPSLTESVDFVGTIVGALHDQRAKDVLVMKTEEKEMTPYTHKVVCSAFNSRQAAAISENLRTLLKMDAFSIGSLSHVKKITKRSNGWYVSDINQIQSQDIESRIRVCNIESVAEEQNRNTSESTRSGCLLKPTVTRKTYDPVVSLDASKRLLVNDKTAKLCFSCGPKKHIDFDAEFNSKNRHPISQDMVHIMSEDCREKYDLETIWAGDDCILEEIEKEKRRIFLPPIRS